ncbi:MAG: hypothetical protein HYX60_06145 [Legionella longbeachae]|nr:hypothetical protein [Legionella longbeachae]
MNNSLLTLQNKLNLQIKDLEMHLQSAQNQIQLLKKQIQYLEVQMNQTNFNSFTINKDLKNVRDLNSCMIKNRLSIDLHDE